MGLTFTEHRLEEGFDVFPPPNTNPCPESGLPPLLGDAHPYFPTPSRRARARRNVPPPPAPRPPPGWCGSGASKRRASRFLQVEPEALAARGGLLAGQPRPSSRAPGVASPLSPSLLCGLPPQPNQPSASEVKSCQTWRRLPALSPVLASQRKANYKNGNFQTSVQWYSNRRLGSTQAQTAFVLFCD